MNIGILGTGVVAKTIGAKLDQLGHSVKLGTRDPAATLTRSEPDMFGGPPIRTWLESHPKVALVPFKDAAAHGEIVFNVLSGQGALAGLEAAAPGLADKILIDVSNPLDFSKGMPPTLSVVNTDSLGEQVQRALPQTKVVKTLNTVNANLMVDAKSLANAEHTMFVAGNDAGAKVEVTKLLQTQFGWKDVIDLGDISMARGTEMYVALWVRLFGGLKTPAFNLKIVR
ncbi:MAG: NAD(P)-binding domain-containing protein [Labilithrix sp.]